MKFTIKKQEPMRISFSMKNASNTNDPVVSKDAIVDVDVLPAENIDLKVFYRTSEGLFWYLNGWHKIIEEDVLSKVAISGKFFDLLFDWDEEIIFDGGDVDVTVAKLDNYYLS